MKLIMHDYEILKKINLKDYKADIYLTFEWVDFLKKALKVNPFVIEIIDNDTIGYFVGAYFKKFGIKIIGSPFRGWDTPYMGLLLKNNYSKINILNEIWDFCKKKFKCHYMEVCDKSIIETNLINSKIKYIIEKTYSMNITKSDEDLLNSFTKHCRKNLKLFKNRGATISKVEYNNNFLDEFYEMLINVFKRQNLNPPYSKEKLKILFENIKEDNMLCLETYNPEGKCIGRSVSFGYNEYCYAFASATNREENYNQKNYLRWEAIRYWRDHGKKYYDLSGIRKYKLEFNPQEQSYVRIIYTKWNILLLLRNLAKKMYWVLNKLKFCFKSKKNKN